MNTQRMLILGVAAVAAGAAALLVRGLMGGGTPTAKAAPPPPRLIDERSAGGGKQPAAGQALTPVSVRWQKWPKSSVDLELHHADGGAAISSHVVQGTVARAPLVAGEPLTTTKIVHADAAGFMAATVTPGMRAVSVHASRRTPAPAASSCRTTAST